MFQKIMLFILVVFICPCLLVDAFVSVGYYSSDSIYGSRFPVTGTPASFLTHLNYAFANVGNNGTVSYGDEWAAIRVDTRPLEQSTNDIEDRQTCRGAVGGNFNDLWRLKKTYPHLRVLLSIGGWGDGSKQFPAFTKNSVARSIFVRTATRMVTDYGFDGIDVGWLFPSSKEEARNYEFLLYELREGLNSIKDGKRYALTIAGPTNAESIMMLRPAKLALTVDWINVLAYNYHVALEYTYHLAPLHKPENIPISNGLSIADTLLAYELVNVPQHQLVVTIPTFGSRYAKVSEGTQLKETFVGKPSPVDYDTVLSKLEEQQWERYSDTAAHASWLFNEVTGELISYIDTHNDLPKHTEYYKQQKIGGLAFWSLSMDTSFPTLSVVRNAVQQFLGLRVDEIPQFKKFPVCAPKSPFCNVRQACPVKMDWAGADVAGEFGATRSEAPVDARTELIALPIFLLLLLFS